MKSTRFTIIRTFALATLAMLLLAACAVPAAPAAAQPTPALQIATHTPVPPAPATGEPTATPSTVSSAPTTPPPAKITLDTTGLASSTQTETIPAVAPSNDNPYWEVLPEYTRLTLQDYPVGGTLMKPQIFVYPLRDLATYNEGAAQKASDLQALLLKTQVGRQLPFLPLYNAGQIIHAQVKFLDFKSGKGVRFLTEFDQAVLPINNYELIYTYQGITKDGRYYIAAVLPVNLPGLPSNYMTDNNVPEQFKTDFSGYLAATVKQLDDAPAASYLPDLGKLDAMMQSLEIQP